MNKQEFIEKIHDFENETSWKFKGDKPVVLKFSAEWCGPCKTTQKILDELAPLYSNVDFYEIDVDEEDELSDYFQVRNIPLIIYINSDGTYTKTVGSLTKTDLKNKIEDLC
jgi:thiol-disulfide isomerase/thioredoxin